MRGKFPKRPRTVDMSREAEQRRRESERADRRKPNPTDWYTTSTGGGHVPPGRTRQVPSTGAPYQTESDGLVLMKPKSHPDPGVQLYVTMDDATEYVVCLIGGSRLLARRSDVEASQPEGTALRVAISRYGP